MPCRSVVCHAPGVPADARPSYAGDSDVWHRADRVSADTPSFLAAPQVAPPSPNVAAACAALPAGRTLPSQEAAGCSKVSGQAVCSLNGPATSR